MPDNNEYIKDEILGLKIDVKGLQNKIDGKIKNPKAEYLDLFVKVAQVTTFTSVIYGAWMLFSFSHNYGVRYTDLAGSNFLIIFGVLSAISILTIAVFPLIIVFLSHFSARMVYNLLIYKTRVGCVKRQQIISLTILNLMLSLWPFTLLFFNGKYCFILNLILPSVFFAIFAISGRDFSKYKWKWRDLKYLVICMISYSLSVLLILITALYVYAVIKDAVSSISNSVLAIVFVSVFFVLNVPTLLIGRKKIRSSLYVLVILFATELFFVFSFPFSNEIGKGIAKVIGLNLESKCFIYDREVVKKIPTNYIINIQQDPDIMKLNVVANINDVYYLSEAGNEKASIRLIGLRITMTNCPKNKKE